MQAENQPRALRFPLQMNVHFRYPGEVVWSEGVTVNMSKTGLLFNTRKQVELGTLLEFVLRMPEVRGESARVVCLGFVVRSRTGVASPNLTEVAVTINDFQFQRETAVFSP